MFHKNQSKTVGGVPYTRYLLLGGDGRTEERNTEYYVPSLAGDNTLIAGRFVILYICAVEIKVQFCNTVELTMFSNKPLKIHVTVVLIGKCAYMKPVQKCRGFICVHFPRLYHFN